MKLFKMLFSGLIGWYATAGLVLTALLGWYRALGNAGVTYFAANYSTPMPTNPGGHVSVTREFSFTVAVALALNDIIKLCKIPGLGTPLVIEDWFLDIPDLDTNGSPAIALSIGDIATPGKFVAIQTAVGQGAGKFTLANAVNGAMPAPYSTNEDFALKVTTGPATGATAVTMKGWMRYHFQGVPTTIV